MESNATGWAVSHVLPNDSTTPDQTSLASVVMKIFCVVSEWSMVIRQSWLTTMALMASKANWCLLVHVGNEQFTSAVVSGVSIAVGSHG